MPAQLSSYGIEGEPDKLPLGEQYPDLNTGPLGLPVMNPGQPTGRKGGGPSNKWALLGAPIMALLGSKLSGGQMGFKDALGALGMGYAEEKLTQSRQERQRKFDQEGQTIEMAHKAVQGLKDLHPETIKQFPQLQQMAMKYQQALIDGKLDVKEASDIVMESARMQHVLAQAQAQQGISLDESKIKRETELKRGLEQEGRMRDIMDLFPTPESQGVDPEDWRGEVQSMLRDRDTMRLERETPVPMQIGGKTFNVLPGEAATMAHQREQERVATERLKLQLNAQAYQLDKQMAMEAYKDARMQWEQNRAAAIAEVGDDGEARAEVIRQFLTTMPVLADYTGRKKGPGETPPPAFGDVQSGKSSTGSKYSNVREVTR